MKKQTMSDLMLKAHFRELRDELNKSLQANVDEEAGEVHKVLKEAYNYLKAKSQTSSLDDRGTRLFEHVAAVLDGIDSKNVELPGKLPMQKATGTRNITQRKTGS